MGTDSRHQIDAEKVEIRREITSWGRRPPNGLLFNSIVQMVGLFFKFISEVYKGQCSERDWTYFPLHSITSLRLNVISRKGWAHRYYGHHATLKGLINTVQLAFSFQGIWEFLAGFHLPPLTELHFSVTTSIQLLFQILEDSKSCLESVMATAVTSTYLEVDTSYTGHRTG